MYNENMQNIQPQRGLGAEPPVGVREAKPPETGVWGEAPRSWTGFC